MTSSALASRSWTDVVNSVAWEFGQNLTDDDATALLFEHTGFPAFWVGDPVLCAEGQLRRLFSYRLEGFVPCPCCGVGKAKPGPYPLCEECESREY